MQLALGTSQRRQAADNQNEAKLPKRERCSTERLQWTGLARKYFEMISHAGQQLKAHSIGGGEGRG
jgi:hypothetical protein